MKKRTIFSAIALLLMSSLVIVSSVTAETPYYKGKTITIVVPYSVGGGTDVMGRVYAKHLPKHIPGKPNIVIRNMPAGAGITGINYVENTARADGTVCGLTGGGTIAGWMLDRAGVKFDLSKMPVTLLKYYGSVSFVRPAFLPDGGYLKTGSSKKFVEQIPNMIWGHIDRVSSVDIPVAIFWDLMNIYPKKEVYGYDGSSLARMALLRNEVDYSGESDVGYIGSAIDLVKDNKIIPVMQNGIVQNEKLIRLPTMYLRDLPTPFEIYEEIHGKQPTGKMAETYMEVVSTLAFHKAFVWSTRIAKEPLKIMQKAFKDLENDKEYLHDWEKILGAPETAYGEVEPPTLKKETRKWLREWLTKRGEVIKD